MPEIKIDYDPLPTQRKFHDSPAKSKWYVGGVGSGKTRTMIMEILALSLEIPHNRILVGRKIIEELLDTFLEDWIEYVPQELYKYESSKKLITIIPTESKIFLRPLNLPPDRYKSYNLGAVFIDEADEVKYKLAKYFYSRLRNKNVPKEKRHICFFSNWEGRNYLWKMFMRGNPNNDKPKFEFFVASTKENTWLDDDYIDDLRSVHSEQWQKRYIDCSLDSFAGLIYANFSEESYENGGNIVKDYLPMTKEAPNYPDNLYSMSITDPGLVKSSILIGQLDTHNLILYIRREKYESDLMVSDLADFIKEQDPIFTLRENLIDPSSEKREQTSGKSVRKMLKEKYGVYTKFANNNIKYGIEIVRQYLMPIKIGEVQLHTRLLVFEECEYTRDEFLEYKFKKSKGVDDEDFDVVEIPEDIKNHSMDDVRYFAVKCDDKIKGIEFNKKSSKSKVRSSLVILKKAAKNPLMGNSSRSKSYNPLMSGKHDIRMSRRKMATA